jgi:hypothetical protein
VVVLKKKKAPPKKQAPKKAAAKKLKSRGVKKMPPTDPNVSTRAAEPAEKEPAEKEKTFDQKLHERIALVGDENLRALLFDMQYGDSRENPGHADYGKSEKAQAKK